MAVGLDTTTSSREAGAELDAGSTKATGINTGAAGSARGETTTRESTTREGLLVAGGWVPVGGCISAPGAGVGGEVCKRRSRASFGSSKVSPELAAVPDAGWIDATLAPALAAVPAMVPTTAAHAITRFHPECMLCFSSDAGDA